MTLNHSSSKCFTYIYKSFVRPHLDHGDILYDKQNNENFQNKLEKVQCRTCPAIAGAIQGTSRTKLYDELSLHSQIKKRWCNKLIFFSKFTIHIWISPLR